jgi:hypothetical protein
MQDKCIMKEIRHYEFKNVFNTDQAVLIKQLLNVMQITMICYCITSLEEICVIHL